MKCFQKLFSGSIIEFIISCEKQTEPENLVSTLLVSVISVHSH